MSDIPNILHKIRLAPDADAMKQAAELVRKLACDIVDHKIRTIYTSAANELDQAPENGWELLLTAISLAAAPACLNSACETPAVGESSRYLIGHTTLIKLAEFCLTRQKRLDAIRQPITPGAMRFVPKLTNLDKNNIGRELKRRIAALGLFDDSRFRLTPAMTSAQISVSAMREAVIQKDLGAAYSDAPTMDALDELEALYGVLLHYFDDRQRQGLAVNFSLCALPGFVYCGKCWRLIPKSYARRQKTRCDLHNYETGKSTDSRKSKNVHDALSADNPIFSYAVEKKLMDIDAVFCKPKYGGIPEEA